MYYEPGLCRKPFLQVKACNGQINNPAYIQQAVTQSSISYEQSAVNRKSNAAKLRLDNTWCKYMHIYQHC